MDSLEDKLVHLRDLSGPVLMEKSLNCCKSEWVYNGRSVIPEIIMLVIFDFI